MIYGSNEKGEGILTLTPEEKERFDKGESIERKSGDAKGMFTIMVKLTRPRSRSKRFPEAIFG